jgi:hypothetical protein
MRTTRSLAPRLLTLFSLGVLVSSAAGGCGGNSNVTPNERNAGTAGSGGSSAGRGGTSGGSTAGSSARGGVGGKGGQGGTMSTYDGGEAGQGTSGAGGATGGAGATSGDGGNSLGGAGGWAGTGGTAGGPQGDAGSAEQGGSAGNGAAGQGGSAGNGAAGMVGVLGTPCSPPGALACAGNYQKLTVLCGGDGEWEPNQTCGVDLYCDSSPGPNVGLCQPVIEECENRSGVVFCAPDERRLVTCGPDAVTKSEVTCDGACHRDMCRDDLAACPEWDDYFDSSACTRDCYGANQVCNRPDGCVSGTAVNAVFGTPSVIRTPWSDEACACEGDEGRSMLLGVYGGTQVFRVTVPPPWSIGSCGDEPIHCAIVDGNMVQIWTPEVDAGPVNVLVEGAGTQDSCPE